MNIILLGAPGSGKGTQAALLSQKYKFHHISTGELCRKEVASGSALGAQLNEIMTTGNLIPDQMVIQLLRKHLQGVQRSDAGFIFDGFPRTLEQAQGLDDLLEDLKMSSANVILINVDKEYIVSRLAERVTCSQCGQTYNVKTNPTQVSGVCDKCGNTEFVQRQDDNEEIILKRLEVYSNLTAPLIPHYSRMGKLHQIDGNTSVEAVFERIEAVLTSLKVNPRVAAV
jgi:adenylate kinase